MKQLKNKRSLLSFMFLFFLSGCASFTGLRTPLYDGEPFEANEEKIEAYQNHHEIIGEEKEHYLRYSFSEDLLLPSLSFSEEDPVLLEEGEYIVGEDVPAGRVHLLGNESYFQSNENQRIRIGNLTIRDQADEVYFENHFHSAYGVLQAQVDFHEGHRIEVIGERPEIMVFYEEEMPEDPYLLMELPEVIANTQERNRIEMEDRPVLYAGIWEVGQHIEAGTYTVEEMSAPRSTELYVFRGDTDPSVVALTQGMAGETGGFSSLEELEEGMISGEVDQEQYEREREQLENSGVASEEQVTIELEEGDVLYPNGVERLVLTPAH